MGQRGLRHLFRGLQTGPAGGAAVGVGNHGRVPGFCWSEWDHFLIWKQSGKQLGLGFGTEFETQGSVWGMLSLRCQVDVQIEISSGLLDAPPGPQPGGYWCTIRTEAMRLNESTYGREACPGLSPLHCNIWRPREDTRRAGGSHVTGPRREEPRATGRGRLCGPLLRAGQATQA